MNLENVKVGKLTIIDRAPDRYNIKTRKKIHRWNVLCECGRISEQMQARLSRGIKNNSNLMCRWCGAKTGNDAMIKKVSLPNRKHPLYKKYHDIKTRLRRDKKYQSIIMCNEWINSFDMFFKWAIDNGWEEGLEIDRRNSSGNYEPSNCRFVDQYLQAQNKRNYFLNPKGNIQQKGNKFVLRVQKNHLRTFNTFNNINDAIAARDILKERTQLIQKETTCRISL